MFGNPPHILLLVAELRQFSPGGMQNEAPYNPKALYTLRFTPKPHARFTVKAVQASFQP